MKYKDRVDVTIELFLSFKDRMKILLYFPIKVFAEIKTENIVGETISSASVRVGKLKPSKRVNEILSNKEKK